MAVDRFARLQALRESRPGRVRALLKASCDDTIPMRILQAIFRRHELTDEQRAREGEKLDAKRRHLRGKMSQITSEIQRSWTQFRTWRGDEKGKKELRAKIKVLEARRKALVKEMLDIRARMKKLGYEPAAGYVDAH